MAVYYKFKSAKDYDSIPIDGHFISVANLKEKIFESKHLGRGTDFDLVVTNAQTNEEYLNEATLIPKNTSVLIRRVPGQPRLRILTAPVTDQDETMVDDKPPEDVQPTNSSFLGADPSVSKYLDDSEWDEFGNDLYAIPEVLPVQSSNPVLDTPPPSKADEDSKIKALIDTPALDWQHQPSDGFGRGFGRGMGSRMMGGRGFGRGAGLERKTPPQGYICHRCKVPGHFIQHCPTNGDPNFDVKRVKPPTGIPKSMLMATPDGSYALPSGAVAVLKPNEAAFEKEIEGMPSARVIGDFPPELRCPLCKQGMKDAVLTSKCCFTSFCDKCIRDYIMSKSACVCGATNILADDLLPNKTLRDTINRLLESNNNNNSAENGGSAFHIQDMESARDPQPKILSPTQSAASKGEPRPPRKEEISNIREPLEQDKAVVNAPQRSSEKGREAKVANISEATHESRSVKEPAASHGSAPMADEEVQQKALSGEAGKKKKKKKVRVPISAAEMQWRNSQEFAAENYMMPMGPPPPPYNPYWNGGMQSGMEGYVGHYPGPMPPYMGYGFGPMDVPFGGVLPPDPFGTQGYMMPPFVPPQRDLAMDFGMGLNGGPPIMSREEFEARKADLKRKREIERRGRSGREFPNDREFGREMSSGGDISSMKLKSKSNIPPPSRAADQSNYQQQQRHRSERPSPEPPRPSSKRKSDYDDDDDDQDYHRDHQRQHHHSSHHRSDSSAVTRLPPVEPPPPKSTSSAAAVAANADRKSKASVFSRISFPEREEASSGAGGSKKRKIASLSEPLSADVDHHGHRVVANGYREDHHKSASITRKSAAVVEYESSDEDRHFKRRPSRYESSPPVEVEEGGGRHHSRGSRDRVREERDRGGHGKHR
ncbi:hypothetical protein LguiA_015429 [Lonicera macranthoides]